MKRPCALTVAGSDPSGGAGIQADLKTFAAHGVYGASVLAALTAQNTRGVSAAAGVEPALVAAQLDAVLSDIPISAVKTGMLFSAQIIEVVAGRLENTRLPLVVDPVCVSGSGHALLKPDALAALRGLLVPAATLLTPNLPEAEALAGLSVTGREEIVRAGEALLAMGAKAVLIKGGHARAGEDAASVTDFLFAPGREPLALPVPRVATRNTHGTGCTLSAAIAANLAKGLTLVDAVLRAQAYLNDCLRAAWDIGAGPGPVEHLAGLSGFR